MIKFVGKWSFYAAFLSLILLLEGFLIQHVFNWFLSPALGLPRVDMWGAIGLSLFYNAMVLRGRPRRETEEESLHRLKTYFTGYLTLWAIMVAVAAIQ
jgi:hypothetical protein